MPKTKPVEARIDKIIGKNLANLRKPGVLTVRPGYEIAGHQLTGNPAIVATVHTKKGESGTERGGRAPQCDSAYSGGRS